MPNLSFDALLRQEWPYLIFVGATLLLLLYRLRPAERRNVWLTLIFSALGCAGLAAAALTRQLGFQQGAMIQTELFSILLGMVFIRVLGLNLFRLLLPALGIDPPRILEDIIVILAYLVWGLLRLRFAGVDLSQLVVSSTIITAVAAFSMQDTLGNILSGISIQLDNSLDLGNWVKVGEHSGRVKQIGWRSTLIETRNGETVVMPNSWLMKNSFLVLGKQFEPEQPALWRRRVQFEVSWQHPPSQIIDISQTAVANVQLEGVASSPAPNTVLMDIKNGIGYYTLRYWLSNFGADDPTDSAVRAHIITALVRQGITLEGINHTLNMTINNDQTTQHKQDQEVTKRTRALEGVELFKVLTEEERRKLAAQLVYAPFEKGDVISRQGAVAHWLYILTLGEVSVWSDWETPHKRQIGQLSAGQCFGEMGMMMGAPRSATVVANRYSECYRLDRQGFEAIITARPEIAEALSQVLAMRMEQNRLSAKQAGQTTITIPAHAELLQKIRNFFRLA